MARESWGRWLRQCECRRHQGDMDARLRFRVSQEIERVAIKSTSLSSIGYNHSTSVLEVEFRNDTVYQFFFVGSEAWNALLNAKSKGSYFNAEIREQYPHRLVERDSPDTLLNDLTASVSEEERVNGPRRQRPHEASIPDE